MRVTAIALTMLLAGLPAGAAGAQDRQSAADRARAFTLDLEREADKPQPVVTPVPKRVPAARPAPRPTPSEVRNVAAEPKPVQAARPVRTPPTALSPVPALASVPGGVLYTLDTPIAQLVADPRARGVLDRRLPGLSTDRNLDKFRSMGLRQFQPLTGGRLTDQMLDMVGSDLAAIRPSTRRGVDR